MEQSRVLDRFTGDTFGKGFPKRHFPDLKEAGNAGSGIDTIVLLEERTDLRIQVEATLSHLFDREIFLEWDSGNLVGKMRRSGGSESYRLDRDECHGIKELLVLLTHIYNDKHTHIIIDEPELNLHPQYQAFFMQEVRKVAGDPASHRDKRVFFLITHSPFILNFGSEDDLRSVISFRLDYSVPKQIAHLDLRGPSAWFPLVGRLNAHHKQLFFSDNPIFVEGILDAQLIGAMMEARDVSVSGAGSCIIDAGGAEEVNHYLELAKGLGKEAHFLYDLDSLFRGNLRACIGEDQSIQSFLAAAGLGNDIGRYCGALDRELTGAIDLILGSNLPDSLRRLGEFLIALGSRACWDKGRWARARVSVMVAISRYPDDLEAVLGEGVLSSIEGRLRQIVAALRERRVHLLPGGTIERYLPCYSGDDYELCDKAKQRAVLDEMQVLAKSPTEGELSSRYGELYDAVGQLPSKVDVDIDPVLRRYLADYIHELQKIVTANPSWARDQIQERLKTIEPSLASVFVIRQFERTHGIEFHATIEVAGMATQGKRYARIDHRTSAGMGDFEIEAGQGSDLEEHDS